MLAERLLDAHCCCDCCCSGGEEPDADPDRDQQDALLPDELPSVSSSAADESGLRFFQDKFESMAFGAFHWFCLFLFFLVAFADGYFFETLPFLFTTFERELGTDEMINGYVLGATSLGVAASAVVAGPLADRIGRLPLLFAGFSGCAIFGGCTSLVRSWEELVVLRVLTGFAIGLQRPVRVSLTAEFLPISSRGAVMVLTRIGWPVGGIVANVTFFYSLPNWRLCLLLSSVPAYCAVLCLLVLVPESPRYLLGRGRGGAAVEVLARIRSCNGSPLQPEEREELEAIVLKDSVEGADEARRRWRSGGGGRQRRNHHQQEQQHKSEKNKILRRQDDQLFQKGRDKRRQRCCCASLCTCCETICPVSLYQPPYAYLTIIITTISCMIGFSSVGIRAFGPTYFEKDKGLSQQEIALALGTGQFGEVIGIASAAVLVDHFGRKPMVIAGFLLTGAATFGLVTASSFEMLTVAVALEQLCASFLWMPMMVFTAESYPTEIRAAAIGLGIGFSRVIGASGAPIGGFFLKENADATFAAFGAIYTLGAAVALLFLPGDTLGRRLSDKVRGTDTRMVISYIRKDT